MPITNENSLVTAIELAAMADEGCRRELVEGVVRMMSPAGGRHGKIAARLCARLLGHVESHNLGDVFAAETGFLLSRDPDTVRAPDVAYVSSERLDALADLTGFLALAPDLVAEVISPSDTFSRVEEKASGWLSAGVKVVLIVDPENRTVHVERGMQDVRILDTDGELAIDDVVPGWRLKIADLFG